MNDIQLFHLLAQPVGIVERFACTRFGQNQRKLLTAIAAEDIALAAVADQQLAELLQQYIASTMPEGIVEALLVIHVKHHHTVVCSGGWHGVVRNRAILRGSGDYTARSAHHGSTESGVSHSATGSANRLINWCRSGKRMACLCRCQALCGAVW